MDELSNQERAVELLQKLGLKEYEAKCFVALSRLPSGTAKEISELSEVPRTRVYDAVRVLETKGLVEIQHSSPQVFRAVSIDEAAATLRDEYESRTESLRTTLRGIESVSRDEEDDEEPHEVWSISGQTAISNRIVRQIDEATREVLLVVGDERGFTESMVETLRAADERGVSIVVGAVDPTLRERVEDALPEAEVFVSGLDWLGNSAAGDDTEIGRLLLTDRSAILVSTLVRTDDGTIHERAVFGQGFGNGLVAITRRLMATGLLPANDPGATADGGTDGET